MVTSTTTARRGRPRDPGADRAILDSARDVLAKRGFTGASMEEIARTAGVGKDTLYRRWRSKQELVRHLLTVLAEENVPVPAEDDPRYALFVFLQDIVRLNTQSNFGAIVAGVVGASARDPELARAFRDFWSDRRQIAGHLVRAIVGSTPTERKIETIVDHLVAPIYYRILLSGAPVDDQYLWDLVAEVPWADTYDIDDDRH
jgi:AcrR family transcriptional regulator